MNKERNLNDDAPQNLRRDIWNDIKSSYYQLNDVDLDGTTDLMVACYLNDIKLVKKLLEMKVDVNIIDETKQNAVTMVVFGAQNVQDIKNSVSLLDLLSIHGANLNQRDCSGITPLGLSCSYDMPEVTQKLVDLKADLYNIDLDGNTALSLACHNKQIQAIHSVCTATVSIGETQKLTKQIENLGDETSKNYALKLLQSISLNFKLEQELAPQKNTTTIKI